MASRKIGSGILLAGGLVLALSQSAAYADRLPVASRPARGAEIHGTHRDTTAILKEVDGGPELKEVDGGPDFYARFEPSLPTSPSFFPIGVWLAAVNKQKDITSDQAAGLNTYVGLTNTSDFSLLGPSGMYFVSNQPRRAVKGTVGRYVNDEVDMWAGAGNAAWTGNSPGQGTICEPAAAACGYTIQADIVKALPKDHMFRWSNYGKGVVFWESDANAEKFVNDYQDVVSVDEYWFADDSICIASQGGKFYRPSVLVNGYLPPQLCHLAANYGKSIDRARYLAGDSKPIWAVVELGHPFLASSWPSITPPEVTAAVWQSLIAGARGIVYFNHSFGGKCLTLNVLRDPCYSSIRAAVTTVDHEIESLAPVLNAPFAENVVTASSGVNISTKWYDGHFYVLAGSNTPNPQTARFSMPCAGYGYRYSAQRETNDSGSCRYFQRLFANGNAVHIYRINGCSA